MSDLDDLYSEPTPLKHQGIRGGRLTGRDIGTVTTEIVKPTRLDPSTSWNFFHPGRVDARFAPATFRATVHGIDPNLDVVWHPLHQRWCVWVRNPRITHWMCRGWQMLFVVKYGDGSYMPLDGRTLATIFDRSPRKWGNARIYFDRLEAEMHHERRQRKKDHEAVVGDIARDHWNFAQIKVGYGQSNGSKFQQHQSGG